MDIVICLILFQDHDSDREKLLEEIASISEAAEEHSSRADRLGRELNSVREQYVKLQVQVLNHSMVDNLICALYIVRGISCTSLFVIFGLGLLVTYFKSTVFIKREILTAHINELAMEF